MLAELSYSTSDDNKSSSVFLQTLICLVGSCTRKNGLSSPFVSLSLVPVLPKLGELKIQALTGLKPAA